MITRLIDGYESCTSPAFNYSLEYVSILHTLGEISTSTAQLLIQLNLDQRRYDGSIAREVNLRPSDLSSVLKSSKRMKYLLSLIREDSEKFSNERIASHPNLCFITHQLNGATAIIQQSHPDNLFELICVRHPYYLLSHWESYMPLLGNSPRDFTLWLGSGEINIPWFIQQNIGLFLESDQINRAALCVIEILEQTFQKLDLANDKQIVVPFENFVLHPWKIISQIEEKFPMGSSNGINSILRREKVPRNHINNGRKLQIYSRYGSGDLEAEFGMKDDFRNQELIARNKLSPKVFEYLSTLSNRYFEEFGAWFA